MGGCGKQGDRLPLWLEWAPQGGGSHGRSRGRASHRIQRAHKECRVNWGAPPMGPAVGLRRPEVHSHRDSGGGPSSAPSWLCDFGPLASVLCASVSPQTVGTVSAQPPRGTAWLPVSLEHHGPLAQPHPLPGTPEREVRSRAHTHLSVGQGVSLSLAWSVRSCTTRLGPLPALTASPLPLVHWAVVSLPPHCFHRTC